MASETVSVMFTDVVGSTNVLSRLGEVAADELRREHFAIVRGAIAQHSGREVKNLGDGVMVVFSGVSAALGCAVAIQQAHAARPADSEPLDVRVGVATGEAEVEDDDYFGLPVVEASRLCALAQGAQILTSEMTRLMARSRDEFTFVSVGDVELKGIPEPLEAFEVQWTRLTAEEQSFPVPVRVSSLTQGFFVGRAEERDVLEAALKDASEGRRRGVLIGGEPGIGKTTLTASVAVEAAQGGAWVLYGRCDEDLYVPYQPWVEALGHLVEHAPQAVLAVHVAEMGPTLGRLTDRLGRRVTLPDAPRSGGDDGDAARQVLFAAVVDLLRRASEQAPVVLLLDDLHWADDPTVQLLRHVLTTAPDLRLLVLATFRDSEVTRRSALSDALAALHREQGVERVALRGFSDVELLGLLEAIAGHDMTDDGVALRDVLLAETDGNPFFVTELLRHLRETGGISQDDDGLWRSNLDVGATGLPVSVREVVATRVGRLGDDVEAVLTMASVIGRDFDLELLARVVDVDEDDLVDLCDRAVEAAVLRETDIVDRYTFAHALVERSLYDELSPSRRVRSHRAVAEAIEDQCGADVDARVGELAHHWGQATRPHDVTKVVDYAQRAARRAVASLAPDEAVRWARQALTYLDDEQQRTTAQGIELRITLGGALRDLADPSHREILLDAATDARTADLPDLLVAAALANTRGFSSAGMGHVDDERVAIIRAALETVGTEPTTERARLLAVLATEIEYDQSSDERFTVSDEALTIARHLDDPRVFVETVTRCFGSQSAPATRDQRRADTDAAAAAADRLGDPVLRWFAHRTAFHATTEYGDRAGMLEHLAVVEHTAERTDILFLRFVTAHMRAVMLLPVDLVAAEAAAAEILTLGAEHWPEDSLIWWSQIIVGIAWQRGTLGDHLAMLSDAARDNPGIPAYRAGEAWCAAWAGETDHARRLLDEARETGFAARTDWMQLFTYSLWAEAVWLIGDADSAEILAPLLEPWTGRFTTSHGSTGSFVDHSAGIVRFTTGDYDTAITHLETALSLYEDFPAPCHEAGIKVALAQAFAERSTGDDDARARTLATEALTVASERGFGYVERNASAVLERLEEK